MLRRIKEKILWLCFSIFLLFPSFLSAEYRAYMLEVYDFYDQTRWELETGFSPDKYILTHGGKHRVGVLIKATWMCYRSTAFYKQVCEIPETILPKFKIGDRVQVNLDKHHTSGWKGVVEVALWREDLKSNVYGIRFESRRRLYARYFEGDLVKVEGPVIGEADSTLAQQTPPAPATPVNQ